MSGKKQSLENLLYDIRRIAEHREVLTEKKIQSIYKSLMKDLRSGLAETYEKYSDKDGRLYMANLDAKRKRAAFLQEIVNNVDNITPSLRKEMENLIDETYAATYKGMSEAVLKADTRGILAEISSDIAVQPDVLKQAVKNNVSKLTLPAVLEKHRGEIIYQIQQTLTIGLINGYRYDQMAKKIVERVGVSETKAKNIARTEHHRNVESGFMDCAEHIQSGLDGSDLIYAATWRTMKDERVRPQQMRKTKSGWKKSYSKNSANHVKMEGVTVKAGELFDLGDGVKAKAPSQSGVAAHDCNCRCFTSFNLMTVEEFAKATGMTESAVRKKYGMTIKGNSSGRETGDTESNVTLLDTLDYNDENAIMKKLRDAEREFSDLTYEVDRTITSDGKIWQVSGSKVFVETSAIERLPNGSSLKGSYSYHNHVKDETNFSFSGQDVALFLDREQNYSGSGDYKYEYSIKRTKDTIKAKYDDIVSEFRKIERTTVYEMAFDGKLNIDEDGYHEVVKILADKYKFIYKRTLK